LENSLKNKAIAIFNLVVDLRHWNSIHDGVYIKSEELKPNPYLNPNSIKSENGETLVWVNPAFMTRQISNIASKRDGFELKITSNKLVNEDNAPNKDEKKILDYFDENIEVPYYWKVENNQFKFMGALKTEQSCLKCHSHQGYKIGDVRGGISVTFDVQEEYEQLEIINNEKEQTIIYLIFIAVGVLISFIIYLNVKRKDEEKISRLNESLELKILELDIFNKTLHKKVKEEVDKQREKENLLIQQSKLAALGEMIGNIAHQWRQPISAVSAIMMNIKWTGISQGVEPKFLNERIKEANEQLQYMSHTIEDFTNFFKPDREKDYFVFANEVKKAYHILKASLEYNNINLQILYKKRIEGFGYANEFSQVVLNIISNAKDVLIEKKIKKPKIIIEIKEDEKNIICQIKDNGGGIEEKNLNRVFEPYFTTKEEHGTGIGLYISKEIIQKHMKGSLFVRNIENGAMFTIIIPKVGDNNAKVERIIRENIASMLKFFFKKVYTANDGYDGLDKYEEYLPDIVMTDLKMPNMGGFELLDELIKRSSISYLMIVSAHTDTDLLIKAIHNGIHRYIVKPVTEDELFAAFEAYFQKIDDISPINIKIDEKLSLDLEKNQALVNLKEVHLNKKETMLLKVLSQNTNKTYTYEEIEYQVWGNKSMSLSAVRSVVRDLRKKIGQNYIVNISGIGYRLK